jgi:hypothetical protein
LLSEVNEMDVSIQAGETVHTGVMPFDGFVPRPALPIECSALGKPLTAQEPSRKVQGRLPAFGETKAGGKLRHTGKNGHPYGWVPS